MEFMADYEEFVEIPVQIRYKAACNKNNRKWFGIIFMTSATFIVGMLCGILIHLPSVTFPASFQTPVDISIGRLRFKRSGMLDAEKITHEVYRKSDTKFFQTQQGSVNKHASFHNSLISSEFQSPSKYGFNNNATESVSVQTVEGIKRISPTNVLKYLQLKRLTDLSIEETKGEFSDQASDSWRSPNKHAKHRIQILSTNLALPKAKSNIKNQHDRSLSYSDGDNKSDSPSIQAANLITNKLQSIRKMDETIDSNGNSGDKINLFRDVNFKNDESMGLAERNYKRENDSKGAANNKIVDQIFWATSLENECPKGFSMDDHLNWKKIVKNTRIVGLNVGCGRMQNRQLTFKDASKACARYRMNTDQIQGEIYSYYLSKLLNISNIPPPVLHTVNSRDEQFKTVHLDLTQSKWVDGKVFVITKWVDNLGPTYIPERLRGDDEKVFPENVRLSREPIQKLCNLVQWSDLIVLDYLTANLDRIVNNMFNKQWNENMMKNPAHNLEEDPQTGQLVFLDNESGLFHGYRLLDKYSPFHENLLNAVCVFRRSTVEAIKSLYQSRDIGKQLHSIFEQNEERHKSIPRVPIKNLKILQQRLDSLHRHIEQCESRHR